MNFIRKNILYIAWTVAAGGMFGSLYISEVLKLTPCILCWFQRIAMYPLVVILGVGILRKNKDLHWYALPLSIIGFLIALYHFLLQSRIIPESAAPCVQGVSCLTKQLELFGFVTIPIMAMAAFAVITVCMLIYKKE